ncbi:hypothetical protein ACTXT7_001373, partial [Hymenolepis weldensis]
CFGMIGGGKKGGAVADGLTQRCKWSIPISNFGPFLFCKLCLISTHLYNNN